ncbi:MAG: rhomboid family intramembrane serine protease [Treponemataceae bacterium]|nr:rhomboid family intramembrane serine protease [Treponemataceae bacterium]
MGIVFNAPVTLTFSLTCIAVIIIKQNLNLLPVIFTAPGCQTSEFAFNWKDPVHYIRLFMHVFGHTDWNQLSGNLAFILLLGPALEDKFGSGLLALMITITAFVTGIINVCFIPSLLMGASGTVFMMILLSSYTTIDKTKIPLTFILVCLTYIGKEFLSQGGEGVSAVTTVAHIAGGICGSILGFMAAAASGKRSKK